MRHWGRRENSKTVFKGLADQHAVKRIFVVVGQGRLMQRVGFLQGQFFNIQPKIRYRYRAADSFGLRQGVIGMFSIPGG